MDSPAADAPILIDVQGVSFSFGSRLVLEDVSLPIRERDFLAIIGPNGSGKTTLVKIILGLIVPDRGRVMILGRPSADFGDRSLLGYIPQKATHFDPLFPASVREVVGMAVRRSGRGRKEEEGAVSAALGVVGLAGFERRRIGALSGGEQQRVFIARALVRRPRLLFLDEPTAGVDAATQADFYGLLGRLNRDQGITIVLVTHDIGIIDKHVNRVACLNRKLVYHGSHAEFCSAELARGLVAGGDHLVLHRH
jgi:zinc transport system ATP-binding protein